MNSLRKARETVIPPDESINIYVQSLVKIYERENRWAREWKAGEIDKGAVLVLKSISGDGRI